MSASFLKNLEDCQLTSGLVARSVSLVRQAGREAGATGRACKRGQREKGNLPSGMSTLPKLIEKQT